MPTLRSDWRCPACGFALYTPIASDLDGVRVGLYNDGRFPGRCIVALADHAAHLDELPDDVVSKFWRDVVEVGRAVRQATGAPRVNYAVLSNAEAHLHAHVIPRQPDVEPLPTRPPWNDPRDLFELDATSSARLRQQLSASLMRRAG